MRHHVLTILVGFGVVSGAVLSDGGNSGLRAQADAAAECDRLAASPNDTALGIAGVAFPQIDGGKAKEACQKALAAQPDNARIAFQLGRAEQRLGNYAAAMALYQKAGDAGYRLADVAIGNLHDFGQGVPQDPAKAADFYRRAADAGIGVGLKNLGDLYADGLGVPEDSAKAIELYRQAAAKGYVDAYGALADALAEGLGQEDDPAPVVAAYLAAAAKGVAAADTSLGHFYIDGRLGLPVDPLASIAHYEAGRAGNDDWATLYLAQILAFGRETSLRDAARAKLLLAELQSSDNEEIKAQAMAFLGELLLQESGKEDEASKLIAGALDLDAENALVLAAEAQRLEKAKDLAGADAALAKAIEADPEWAPLYFRRAALLDALNQPEKAETVRAAAASASQGTYFVPAKP